MRRCGRAYIRRAIKGLGVWAVAPNVHWAGMRTPLPLRSWRRAGVSGAIAVNLGIELEREVSPAIYLWDRRSELPCFAGDDVVEAALETALALEQMQFGRARRCWRTVVKAAQEAGRGARCEGLPARRVVADIGRVREAVETVLFDGRLPPDLAAWAARCAAKMCGRVMDHALRSYWQEAADGAS